MYHFPIKCRCIWISSPSETNTEEFTVFSCHSYDRFTIPMILCQVTHWNSSGFNLYFLLHQNPCHVKAQQIRNFANADHSVDFKRTVRRKKSPHLGMLLRNLALHHIYSGQRESYPSIWSMHNLKIYKMLTLKPLQRSNLEQNKNCLQDSNLPSHSSVHWCKQDGNFSLQAGPS